ncbi:MAG: hypothetical protein L6437_14040, partial [Kiritimatiellae bacterium]|nr:hypothetical protein [Kiritimatiellia bacterium]
IAGMLLSFVLLGRHYPMTAGVFQLFHFLWDANEIKSRQPGPRIRRQLITTYSLKLPRSPCASIPN